MVGAQLPSWHELHASRVSYMPAHSAAIQKDVTGQGNEKDPYRPASCDLT